MSEGQKEGQNAECREPWGEFRRQGWRARQDLGHDVRVRGGFYARVMGSHRKA